MPRGAIITGRLGGADGDVPPARNGGGLLKGTLYAVGGYSSARAGADVLGGRLVGEQEEGS